MLRIKAGNTEEAAGDAGYNICLLSIITNDLTLAFMSYMTC